MGYGSWIGGGLGWAFGGPIGGLIGFVIGSVIDGATRVSTTGTHRRVTGEARRTTGGDLGMSLVVLTAAVMKADGSVTKAELDHVKRFFRQQFGEVHAKEMLLVLRDVLKRDIPVQQVCAQIRQHMPHAMRLQLVHYLIGLANSDGQFEKAEQEVIRRIAHYLGVSEKDLGSMSAMFRRSDLRSAYQILEVDPKATDDEVKKAYRRMAKKFHPDRVTQVGEEFQQAATEKFRKVQEAYERICAERGIK